MLTFAAIFEEGSLSAAARRLQVSTNAVSKRLMRLERALGVKLLHRSTRALSATEEGRALYLRAQRIADELKFAENEISESSGELRGRIRIAIPGSACNANILRGIEELLSKHPSLELHVAVTNGAVDPIRGGYDIALHVGKVEDSRLVARRLFAVSWGLAASPHYLRRHGTPKRLADLSRHICLRYASTPPQHHWSLVDRSGRMRRVAINGNFQADDSRVLGDAVYAGLGIGIRPSRELQVAVREKKLVRVLPGYAFAPLEVFALMPRGVSQLPRVARFLELFAAALRAELES